MKIAVVTASFGGMDAAKSLPSQTVACEYLAFSEKNSPLPLVEFTPRMKAKFFKLQAHKIIEADYFIWIDGNVQIKTGDFVEKVIDALMIKAAEIALARHPLRGCIYDEAAFIERRICEGDTYLAARYTGLPIAEESEAYRRAGHPANGGLWWCGLFSRRSNKRVNAFFDAWWESCLRWSYFDQNSFAFLARKLELEISEMQWGSFYDNETYKISDHLKEQ